MDRFEIAVHFKNQRIKLKAYHFPATRYAKYIEKYIEYCIENEGIFLADNVPEGALERALVCISKIYDTPIIVRTEFEAQMFFMANSFEVFSLENLSRSKYALCYNCCANELPFDYNIVGTIYTSREPFVFL